MTEASLISLFVRPLNRLRIPYMVTGGVALVIYGDPRFTRDIDLVIALRPQDASRFAGAWPPADFYVPPIEVMREESRRSAHGHFNLSKLQYFQMGKSDRHLRDIHQMLRISGEMVDRPELERWVAKLGTEREWALAQDYQEPA